MEEKMNKKILVSLLVLLLSASIIEAVGLGVSPSEVKFKDILRNREYQKNVRIQSTASYPVNVTLNIEQYNNWIKYPTIVEVPANGYKDVILALNVPKKTPLGYYETMAYATGQPANYSGITIILRIGFKIFINVTNEKIYDGYVDNILTRDITKGNPFKILVGYWNKGNVDNKVIVRTTVYRQGDYFMDFNRQFTIPAFTSQELTAQYLRTNEWQIGQYSADVKVSMLNGRQKQQLTQKTVYFKVT